MDNDLERIIELTDLATPNAVTARRYLHQNPELSEQEANTKEFICRKLNDLGIEYIKMKSGHGVIATIYGKDRTKAVGIRADIDALPVAENVDVPFKSIIPGVMHACGHDVHTAVLLGAAQVLKTMEKEFLW